jgi:hypothetical protein
VINKVNAKICSFDIFRDKSVLPRERKPGCAWRILNFSIVSEG